MSKKDYQAIAGAIYRSKTRESDAYVIGQVADNIADVLRADNPRFNRARFLEACETGACKGMKRREVA